MWTLPPVCDTLSEAGNELGAMAVRGVIVAILSAPRHLLRRGVTLIEAVLFIAVALTLIVGGLVFYQQASLAYRFNQEVRVVSAIVEEARTAAKRFKPGDFFYINDLVNYLIASGAIPSSVVVPPGTFTGGHGSYSISRVRNSWGGAIGLTYANAPDYMSFTVRWYDLPIAACTRLAIVDEARRSRVGEGVWSVTVSDINRSPYSGQTRSFSAPFDPEDAATWCREIDRQSDRDGKVDVDFNFRFPWG
jgi:hypothetical protein